MTDEEKIMKAYEISLRRKNSESNKNHKSKEVTESKHISKFTKFFIQMISSICIFGIVYFSDMNNLFAFDKIKPYMQNDTDFVSVYNTINSTMRNWISQEEQSKSNQTNSYMDNNANDVGNNNDNANGDNIKNDNSNKDNTNDNNVNEIFNDNNEQEANQNSVGGGNDGTTASTEELDDVSYIKKNVSIKKPLENGVISSRYGDRTPTEIVSAHHEGIDIAADVGTAIFSAMDGEVTLVSTEGDYGNHVKITNGEVSTLYAHCSKILVNEGDKVTQGQKIAEVGSTGRSTGPHLHFEIRRKNVTVDPEDIIEL